MYRHRGAHRPAGVRLDGGLKSVQQVRHFVGKQPTRATEYATVTASRASATEDRQASRRDGVARDGAKRRFYSRHCQRLSAVALSFRLASHAPALIIKTVRKQSGGELKFPAVEWPYKGFTAVSSPGWPPPGPLQAAPETSLSSASSPPSDVVTASVATVSERARTTPPGPLQAP
eukprot:1187879-Prorocentrum_minimum.AAC.1